MKTPMAIFAAGALGALAICAPCWADPAPAPAQAPAPNGGATPARSTHAAVRLALARQAYELIGGVAAVDAQTRASYASVEKAVAQSLPPEQAGRIHIMYQLMLQEVLKLTPTIVDVEVHAYAEILTEQELRDNIAFLSTASGRSILRKMPLIQQAAMDRTTPLIAGMLPGLMRRVADQVCEQTDCSAKDRQVIETALARSVPTRGS